MQGGKDQSEHLQSQHRSPARSFETASSIIYIPPCQDLIDDCHSDTSSLSLEFIRPRNLSDPFLVPPTAVQQNPAPVVQQNPAPVVQQTPAPVVQQTPAAGVQPTPVTVIHRPPVTVIHRPDLRPRPSVRSRESFEAFEARMRFALEDTENYLRSYTADATDPSIQKTSGNTSSPTGVSTGLTSLFSDGSGKQYPDTKKKAQQQGITPEPSSSVLADLHINSLTPIPEASASRKPCEFLFLSQCYPGSLCSRSESID